MRLWLSLQSNEYAFAFAIGLLASTLIAVVGLPAMLLPH